MAVSSGVLNVSSLYPLFKGLPNRTQLCQRSAVTQSASGSQKASSALAACDRHRLGYASPSSVSPQTRFQIRRSGAASGWPAAQSA